MVSNYVRSREPTQDDIEPVEVVRIYTLAKSLGLPSYGAPFERLDYIVQEINRGRVGKDREPVTHRSVSLLLRHLNDQELTPEDFVD